MLYFDYASNMDEEELKGYVRGQGGDPSGISNPRHALLRGWRLVFNFLSPRRQAGTASIELAPHEHVEGVLWDVDDKLIHHIDHKEGHPQQYHRLWVAVEVGDSYLEHVLTYGVIPEQRCEFCPPTLAYRQLMVDAARRFKFTMDYIRNLEGIRALD